ncbi:hypothetical protein U1Q18_016751 [Sarracenia purpurea var. burkii]
MGNVMVPHWSHFCCFMLSMGNAMVFAAAYSSSATFPAASILLSFCSAILSCYILLHMAIDKDAKHGWFEVIPCALIMPFAIGIGMGLLLEWFGVDACGAAVLAVYGVLFVLCVGAGLELLQVWLALGLFQHVLCGGMFSVTHNSRDSGPLID